MTSRHRSLALCFGLALALAVTVGLIGRATASRGLDHLVSTHPATQYPVVDVTVTQGQWNDDQEVWDLTPYHELMYGCGQFTNVTDNTTGHNLDRSNAFLFNRENGSVSESWQIITDGTIFRCLVVGDNLVIAGGFTHVNGVAQANLAAIDLDAGRLDRSFTPNVNHHIEDAFTSKGRLFLCGAFSTIDGHQQGAIGTVDPATGRYDPYFRLHITGLLPHSGIPNCTAMALRPDGSEFVSTLAAQKINGNPRRQVAKYDLDRDRTRLQHWSAPLFTHNTSVGCKHARTELIARGLDYSPNGRWFEVATRGGGASICDSITRWDASERGLDVRPVWQADTCGDTMLAIADTGKVIYAQGHQKCMEANPGRPSTDQRPRNGILALNTNGHLLKWRSDQARCRGGKELQVTKEGLWAGIDCPPGLIFRPLS